MRSCTLQQALLCLGHDLHGRRCRHRGHHESRWPGQLHGYASLDYFFARNRIAHDIRWSDLREIRNVRGGYGVRNLDLVLSHEASERLGLVRPSTRNTAPDLLVGRKISLPLALFALGGDEIMARMTQAADHAGHVIEKCGRREYLVLSEVRFSVKPKG